MDNKENMMRLVCGVALVICTALLSAVWSFAGDVEPDASPGATMKSLQEVHDKVEEIDAKMTGVAPVARTGQTRMYYCQDDGWIQAGVAWPDPRFTENGDGTATDNLTGLVWLKNVQCTDEVGGVDMITGESESSWNKATEMGEALVWVAALADGYCGLSDGSEPGDWRLPNMRELLSLVDYGRSAPPRLPEGHPFENFNFDTWYVFPEAVSTTVEHLGVDNWTVNFFDYTITSITSSSARGFGNDMFYMPVRDAKAGEQGGVQ